MLICPECKAIAEYNSYYGRIVCTRCSWESNKVTRNTLTRKENRTFSPVERCELIKAMICRGIKYDTANQIIIDFLKRMEDINSQHY